MNSFWAQSGISLDTKTNRNMLNAALGDTG